MMPFLICWKHRESKSMKKSGMHDIVERIKDDLKKNGIGCAAVLACLILLRLFSMMYVRCRSCMDCHAPDAV